MDFDNIDWWGILGKVLLAIVIILVTWILARVVRWAIGKLVGKVSFLQRQGQDGQSLGESIGTVASLLVWLFGLTAILQLFALTQVLAPIQSLLSGILGFLPNLIGAAFVFVIGYVLAKIVRQLVETAIRAVNFSKLSEKVKSGTDTVLDEARGSESGAPTSQPQEPSSGFDANKIAGLVGNLVFAIILIVVSIAALQILGISAISDPAEQMLSLILNAIPAIIAAAIILGLGYLISTFVGNLLESTLQGLGTDRAIAKLEIVPEGQSASTIITRIAQVAIMVFFAIMAARALDFPEVTAILNEVLELGGKVLFGGVIIAAGFLVASLLSRLVGSGTASTVIKWVTIALFTAMGLKYMEIADSIINLAFGAVVVGGALAAALAFGLGGRDAAARTLAKLDEKKSDGSHTPPPSNPTSTPQPPTGP
ncbi:mechanosensitive ion channel [Ruania alkalisoli]|uniref:Mechanosensitive ion channel n=1 Tax=Ruania alkalisoli TaxID=2779775 RepID=A0A7M1SUE3_9MICO|nr:mechanosensitive ion channel [Ruania alkalisoli]QOR71188.1 mechanosensitive ion channel [Ruania alkalisoli]